MSTPPTDESPAASARRWLDQAADLHNLGLVSPAASAARIGAGLATLALVEAQLQASLSSEDLRDRRIRARGVTGYRMPTVQERRRRYVPVFEATK